MLSRSTLQAATVQWSNCPSINLWSHPETKNPAFILTEQVESKFLKPSRTQHFDSNWLKNYNNTLDILDDSALIAWLIMAQNSLLFKVFFCINTHPHVEIHTDAADSEHLQYVCWYRNEDTCRSSIYLLSIYSIFPEALLRSAVRGSLTGNWLTFPLQQGEPALWWGLQTLQLLLYTAPVYTSLHRCQLSKRIVQETASRKHGIFRLSV